jgi:predicted Zn-dependent protease with MMP-like domain
MNAEARAAALVEEANDALDEGDAASALDRFEAALRDDPEHWGAALGRVEALHLLWRAEEALRAVRELAPPRGEEDDPDRAELEGRILEVLGDLEGADRLFAEAHRLEPDDFPLPVRMNESDFRGILDKVLESMPNVIRETITQVPVLVELKPTAEVADRAPHINPDIVGLFVGSAVGERVTAPSGYPDVVLLFQRNLERAGRSRNEVAREIKITLLHEYGHYLGFDEEELEHLGLG